MFYRIIRRIRGARRHSPRRKSPLAKSRKDYLTRKEAARGLVIKRLEYFAGEYARLDPAHEAAMRYGRISIKDLRSRWGSCSSKKNLNFNYRVLDLPPELRDYIVVHELCHLEELHHGKVFWDLVEIMIPQAKKFHHEVRRMKLP